MTTSVTDDRARFEAYWRSKENFKESFLAVDGRYPDYYGNPVVQGSWEGYQAALRSQGKVVSVDALQGLCDEWENMKVPHSASSYELGMFDGYRGAHSDLTAIIGEGD